MFLHEPLYILVPLREDDGQTAENGKMLFRFSATENGDSSVQSWIARNASLAAEEPCTLCAVQCDGTAGRRNEWAETAAHGMRDFLRKRFHPKQAVRIYWIGQGSAAAAAEEFLRRAPEETAAAVLWRDGADGAEERTEELRFFRNGLAVSEYPGQAGEAKERPGERPSCGERARRFLTRAMHDDDRRTETASREE